MYIYLNLRLRPVKINANTTGSTKTVWDIFGDALMPIQTDCSQKYSLCPLTEADLSAQSILSGLF